MKTKFNSWQEEEVLTRYRLYTCCQEKFIHRYISLPSQLNFTDP